MSDFTNLTRSDLRIVDDDGFEFLIPKSGTNSDVRKIVTSVYKLDGVPVTEVDYQINNMPNEKGLWIVSWKTLMTMKALGWDTDDVFAPDAFIRDKKGQVTGARSLVRLA